MKNNTNDSSMKMARRMIEGGKHAEATQLLLHETIKELSLLTVAVERLAERVRVLEGEPTNGN